jgi:hypothetical protein
MEQAQVAEQLNDYAGALDFARDVDALATPDLAQLYAQVRAALERRIQESNAQTIQGPATILVAGEPGSLFSRLDVLQVPPANSFTGRCIVLTRL